ncbi:hypothetical protein SIO70_23985 [Chitinophaga sancti]|nr:hypothetical protein [Chitinophaga sancti]WPQ61424.1 hypothetical protein SIO70_23985 [Chitinophaga sancti]
MGTTFNVTGRPYSHPGNAGIAGNSGGSGANGIGGKCTIKVTGK